MKRLRQLIFNSIAALSMVACCAILVLWVSNRHWLRVQAFPVNVSRQRFLATHIRSLRVSSKRLDDVVRYLGDVSGMSIDVDWPELAKIGVRPDTELSISFKDGLLSESLAAVASAVGATVIDAQEHDGVKFTTLKADRPPPLAITWVQGTGISDERPFSNGNNFTSFDSIGRFYDRGTFGLQVTLGNHRFTFISHNGFLLLSVSPSSLLAPYQERRDPAQNMELKEGDLFAYENQVFQAEKESALYKSNLFRLGRPSMQSIGWPFARRSINIPYWMLILATLVLPALAWTRALRRSHQSVLLPTLTMLCVFVCIATILMWAWSCMDRDRNWYEPRYPHNGICFSQGTNRWPGGPRYAIHSFGVLLSHPLDPNLRLIGLGYGWLLLAFASLPAARFLFWRRRLSRPMPGLCAICGYDLRASPHRCPECGTIPPGRPLNPSAQTHSD